MQINSSDLHQTNKSVDFIFLTMSMGCGGTERVVTRLCEYFSTRQLAIAVVSIADQEDDFFKLPTEVVRLRLSSSAIKRGKISKIFSYILLMSRLRATLKRLDAHHVASFLPVPNVLFLLASIGLPVKKIVCERNNPYLQQDLNPAWKVLRRLCYPLADKITVNSEAAEEFCKLFRKRTDVIRISNPPMPYLEPVDALANRIILYAGRIVHQKGIDILLAAASEAKFRHRGWTLVLIGDGSEKAHLLERSRQLGLEKHILWKAPTERIVEEYRKAGFVVLPSRYEGTSNSVLEALAMGLPVVASQAGAGDAVKDGFNGIVLQKLSAESLASALDRVTSDQSLREQLTRNCIDQINPATFTKKMAEWERVFESPSLKNQGR